MKVKLLEGNASDVNQITIEEIPEKKLELLYCGNSFQDVLRVLIQLMNDEDIDIINNFHTIRIEK